MAESLDEPGQGEGRARHPKPSREERAAQLAARSVSIGHHPVY